MAEGNCFEKNDKRRVKLFSEKGIHFPEMQLMTHLSYQENITGVDKKIKIKLKKNFELFFHFFWVLRFAFQKILSRHPSDHITSLFHATSKQTIVGKSLLVCTEDNAMTV